MKILQVLHQFLPKYVGGIELYVKNTSQELVKSGNDVLIFSGEGDVLCQPVTKENTHNGLKIITLGNKNITSVKKHQFFHTFKNPAVVRIFEHVLDNFHPDVIHFHHTMYLSGELVILAKKRGIPTVLTIHDYWFLCHKLHLVDWRDEQCNGNHRGLKCSFCLGSKQQGQLSGIKSLLYAFPLILRTAYQRKVLQSFDLLFVPSNFIQDILNCYSGLSKNIRYMPYTIPESITFHKSKPSLNEIRFGYLGTIKRHKGTHLLVDAFSELANENTSLNIYGDTSLDNLYFHQLRQRCQNNRLFFKGPYTNEKVGEVFSDIDVLIVPSIWRETGPIVILEALANEKPVIAANIGGMSELIREGENGFLFEQGNSKSMLRCMRSILENPRILDSFNIHLPFDHKIEFNIRRLLDTYQHLLKHKHDPW